MQHLIVPNTAVDLVFFTRWQRGMSLVTSGSHPTKNESIQRKSKIQYNCYIFSKWLQKLVSLSILFSQSMAKIFIQELLCTKNICRLHR